MQFFQELQRLIIDNTDLMLKISKTDNDLMVLVQPKSTGKETTIIPPFVIKGTPEEMDREFFNLIQKPVLKAKGIITNAEWHDKTISEKPKIPPKRKTPKTTAPIKPKISTKTPVENTIVPPKTDSKGQPVLF